jgi:hypothetical protein
MDESYGVRRVVRDECMRRLEILGAMVNIWSSRLTATVRNWQRRRNNDGPNGSAREGGMKPTWQR